jgi:hypothetical protein
MALLALPFTAYRAARDGIRCPTTRHNPNRSRLRDGREVSDMQRQPTEICVNADRPVIVHDSSTSNRAELLRRHIALYRQYLAEGVEADLAGCYLREIVAAGAELAEIEKGGEQRERRPAQFDPIAGLPMADQV